MALCLSQSLWHCNESQINQNTHLSKTHFSHMSVQVVLSLTDVIHSGQITHCLVNCFIYMSTVSFSHVSSFCSHGFLHTSGTCTLCYFFLYLYIFFFSNHRKATTAHRHWSQIPLAGTQSLLYLFEFDITSAICIF